jgi:hypothetical protein
MTLEEKVNYETGKAAEILGLPIEDVREKMDNIVQVNDLDMANDEDVKLGLVLFRQWFNGMKRVQDGGQETSTGSRVKSGFGMLVAVEEARDFEDWNRTQLQAEYLRDRNETFNAGKFAYAEQLDDGNYKISQIMENELVERTQNAKGEPYSELPPSVMEIDGKFIIPIDERKELPWGENPGYGHPRPLNNWRRQCHFIGEVGDSGISYWRIGTKGDIAQNWNVETERFVYLDGIWNAEKGEMYTVQSTLDNVVYNDDMENPKNVDGVTVSDLVADNMREKITPLVNLENYHNQHLNDATKTKVAVTDGNVTNMNLTPNSTGNRTLFISDINADFDYDSDGYSSTPCWIPPHVVIDFGIGSHVLVIGRTSQSTNQETGELRQVSINVFGILVLDRRGSPVEVVDSGEQYSGWF